MIETTITKFTQSRENGILSSIKTQDLTLQGKLSVSNFDAAIQTDEYEMAITFPKKTLKKKQKSGTW